MRKQLHYIAPSIIPRPTNAFLDRSVRPHLPDNPQTIEIPEQRQPRIAGIYDAMDSQWGPLDVKLHLRLTSKD